MIRVSPDDYEQAQLLLQGCMDILGNKEPSEFQSLVIDNLKQIIAEFRSTMH